MKRTTYGFTRGELLMVVGVIALLAAVAIPNFLEVTRNPKISRDRSDMRSLATALETYFVEHGAYPATVPLADFTSKKDALRQAGGGRLTACYPGGGVMHAAGLTTPIGYVKEFKFRDQFSPDPKHLPYAYHTDGGGWILISAGPDLDYDINPVKDYDSNTTQPSDRILVLSFDPTNGMRSDGDVWRVKQ